MVADRSILKEALVSIQLVFELAYARFVRSRRLAGLRRLLRASAVFSFADR
jgi:hypothetical protein